MSHAVCQPYMSKPGQSLSEKPCEPPKQTNMDLVTKKIWTSILKAIFVQLNGSYPLLSSKVHLSRTVPFHTI